MEYNAGKKSAGESSSSSDRNLATPGIQRNPVAEEITLKELLFKIQNWYRYLISKWMTICIAGVIGGLLGLVLSFVSKPVYTATTTFVLESGDEGGGGMGQYAGLASMVGINIGSSGGGGIFQGDNIIELYKSRTMVEKTLLTELDLNGEKQTLIERYIDINDLRKKWKPELAKIDFKAKSSGVNRLQDSIIGEAVKDISKNYLSVSKPDKKLSIIKVEVKAEDEVFAKVFNEQVVKNVNDFYVRTKTKKSLQNVEILQAKTDSVRSVMNGAIYSAASVADETPNLNPTRQIQRMAPMQRSQFTAETNKAILGELVKNLEMTKITLLKESPLIQVIDMPVLPLTKEKVGRLKGLVIGASVGVILILVVLTFRLFVRKVMSSE